MKTLFKRLLSVSMLILFALIFSAIGVTSAQAGTLVVTNTADSGAGSLRDTLASAGVGDTITFDSSLSGGRINLASTLTLTKNVIIDGSALALPITISGDSDQNGTGNVLVFLVNSDVTATLNRLVITKGISTGYGGGIFNQGTLTVMNSTFSGNIAGWDGGGIYNNGTLTVTNSTFSGNSTQGFFGGGIYSKTMLTVTNSRFYGNYANVGGGGMLAQGIVTVTGSVFSGNVAKSRGGGIDTYGATLKVSNSTFSGNSTNTESGGGIFNSGGSVLTVLTLTNSTFSGNSSGTGKGGGIFNSGTLYYANTIIANSTGSDCFNSIVGTIGVSKNNLVEDGSCSASLSGDPKLAPLASNGGVTQTFALLSNSPAINAGDDAICAAAPVNNIDQRGVIRPKGPHCEIGAYEYVFSAATPTPTPTKTAIPTTISIASNGIEDGSVLETAETSNVGGTTQNFGAVQVGDDAAKKQYRGILSFDTSSIPDTAKIIGVFLKIKQQAIYGGGNPYTSFNGCFFDMKNGFFGTTVNLEAVDFQSAANGMYGPSLIPPNFVNSVYSFNLSGGAANINKLTTNAGRTQIRMRFVLDDNNDAIANYLNLYSGNAVNAADRPQLVVTYLP